MVQAFKRLFLISFVFSTSFILSLFILRKIGQKSHVNPIKSLNLQQDDFIFLHGGRSDLSPFQSPKAIKRALKNPNIQLALDLYYDPKDSTWKISSQRKSHPSLFKERKEKIKQTPTLNLKEFLALYPKNRLVLFNIFNFNQNPLNTLLKTLTPRLEEKKSSPIIIRSPFSKALKFLRKTSPELLFASHPSSLTQIHLMSFLFIETLHKIKSDVFILSPKDSLTPRALKEIHKRAKIILKIKTIEDYKNYSLKNHLSGLYIKEPKEFFKNCSPQLIGKIKIQNLIKFCK